MKRVLRVEDDALTRSALARALVRRMPGLVVDTAVDGEEAMRRLVAERYDCLIVDVCLGGSLEGAPTQRRWVGCRDGGATA